MTTELKSDKKPHILIAPLDWGLGHATRCIPLIRALREKGMKVTVAAEGPIAQLIKDNFPEVPIVSLRGYRIRYSKRRWFFTLRIVIQIPKILLAIYREKRWLDRQVEKGTYDFIISDNRYGLYSTKIPSVILTHQLEVITGMGKLMDRWLRNIHYRFIGQFAACWIVDEEGENNLGGKLSHPDVLPSHSDYIGWLSQFGFQPGRVVPNLILILLSGPEPLRTLLEEKLLRQAVLLTDFRFVVVGGKVGGSIPQGLPDHITYHSYLAGSALAPTLREAELVICRSGYSTLMDLTVLEKNALLIPTPGQSEQEYLGKRLSEKGICLTRKQEEIDLLKDIPLALTFSGFKSISLQKRPLQESKIIKTLKYYIDN